MNFRPTDVALYHNSASADRPVFLLYSNTPSLHLAKYADTPTRRYAHTITAQSANA